jgi:RNA polymerase sigma factor (sigma-70 family)
MKLKSPEDGTGTSYSLAIDNALLQRLKQSPTSDAWHELFRHYWPSFLNLCRSHGLNPDDSQDVAQETLVAVAQKIFHTTALPKPRQFEYWVLNVLRNKIIDSFRHSKKTEPLSSESLDAIPSPEPEPFPERERLLIALDGVRRLAREHDFAAFEIAILDDKGVAEASHSLHTSSRSIYSSTARVKKILRTQFARAKEDS